MKSKLGLTLRRTHLPNAIFLFIILLLKRFAGFEKSSNAMVSDNAMNCILESSFKFIQRNTRYWAGFRK